MGAIHVGPKHNISKMKQTTLPAQPIVQQMTISDNSNILLQNRISELEHQLSYTRQSIDVPTEIIKYVDRFVEVPIERTIEVPVEKLVTQEVERIVHVPVEVLREKIVEKVINIIPNWVYGVMGIELLLIVLMYLK